MEAQIELDKYVEAEIPRVKEIIRDTSIRTEPIAKAGALKPGKNLYTMVLDELSDSTRNEPIQIAYLSTYEKALALYRATSLEMRKHMDVMTLTDKLESLEATINGGKPEGQKLEPIELASLKAQLNDAVLFSNRYALYFAGNAGLSMLESKPADVKNSFTFGSKYDGSVDRDAQTSLLASIAAEDFQKVISERKSQAGKLTDDDVKSTLECIFTSWVNQFKWGTFEDTAKRYGFDKTKLKSGNFSLLAGDYKRKYDVVEVDDRFMRITLQDVVGNKSLIDTLQTNLTSLACYDPDTGKNAWDPINAAFIYGVPGVGKTFTINAVMRWYEELCKEKRIPCQLIYHSVTDFASAYQNQTSINLNNLITKIREFPGISVMYIPDVDTVMQSRKATGLTAEQNQTIGIYLKMFDGTLIPRGKFLAVMDANDINGIDDAAKSRLFEAGGLMELTRWTAAEDFAGLARLTYSKGLAQCPLSDADLSKIGTYLLKSPLSVREAASALKGPLTVIKPTPDMVGKSYSDQIAVRTPLVMDQLKTPNVLKSIDDYIKTRMEIERAAAERRKQDDANRFLNQLIQDHSKSAKKETQH